MSGWDYETLRNEVEHAVADSQTDFLRSHGIEDITQIDTDLGEDLERAIVKIADCIQRQLVLERNPISVHYCEKDDMTFIMQNGYNEYGNLYRQECIGWYYGEPDAELTKTYTHNLIADYTSADHRLKGAER